MNKILQQHKELEEALKTLAPKYGFDYQDAVRDLAIERSLTPHKFTREMSSTNPVITEPTICIPRTLNNVSSQEVKETMEAVLGKGTVDRVDIVRSKHNKLFARIFIYMRYWPMTDPKVAAVRETLMAGGAIKIVYNHPWFWKAIRCHPRRLVSGYLLFSLVSREEAKKELLAELKDDERIKTKDIMILIAKKWKNLSDKDKEFWNLFGEKWNDLSDEDRERWNLLAQEIIKGNITVEEALKIEKTHTIIDRKLNKEKLDGGKKLTKKRKKNKKNKKNKKFYSNKRR